MRMMKAIDCKACRNEIEDAASGEHLRAAALRHLETCARCRSFQKQRQALRELVSSSLGTTIAAPHDFEWRLRARLNADKRSEQRRPRLWPGSAPGAQAIALAASFVLVIGIAVLLKQTTAERSGAGLPVETASAKDAKASSGTVGGSVNLALADDAPSSDGSRANLTRNRLTQSRLRGARFLSVKSPRVKTEMAASAASSTRLPVSNDFSSRAAPVINLFSVPVRPPSQTVKVLLDEGRGTMRTVSLQPVTFGSQAILERRGDEGAGDDIW